MTGTARPRPAFSKDLASAWRPSRLRRLPAPPHGVHPDDWALWTADPSMAPSQWRASVAAALGLKQPQPPSDVDDTRPVSEVISELRQTVVPRAREAARLLAELDEREAALVRPALARRLGVPVEPLADLEAELRELEPASRTGLDPLVDAVRRLLAEHGGTWSGCVGALVDELAARAALASRLSAADLRDLGPALAEVGVRAYWALDRVRLTIARSRL